jgi:hypothetical protein
MAKPKAPVTKPGKDYKAIRDLRGELTAQRSKTVELFNYNQKLGDEAVSHLEGIYKARGVKSYKSDPGFVYYKDLIGRMTHCHTRSCYTESIAKIVSDFKTGLGSKPTGDAVKLLNILEGRMANQLQNYCVEYHKDELKEK